MVQFGSTVIHGVVIIWMIATFDEQQYIYRKVLPGTVLMARKKRASGPVNRFIPRNMRGKKN